MELEMYGIERVKGKATALSPLFSGGNEKTGITISLNRIKYLVDGEALEVPFVSGNEVRGYLRRLIFQDYLNLAGYELDLKQKADKEVFQTLYSGGTLRAVEEKVSGTIDLSFKRRIYETLLPARLLGFSFGNQMIEGKLKVSNMVPICKELAQFLPEGYSSNLSMYELLSQQMQTRRDELGETKAKDEQAIKMILEHEVFSPGSQFYLEFAVEDPEELSCSTLARMLELWKQKPYIGGKSSIGYGQLKIEYESQNTDAEYLKFIEANKEQTVKTLDQLKGLFSS